MNILFLTMFNFKSFSDSGIYEDLAREFVNNRHNVYVVAPTEKRNNADTAVTERGDNYALLRVKTGNLQKTGFIKKGIATVRVSAQFKKAIKKHFRGIKFDVILYSTPPITLYDAIKYFKNRDNAKTYLLLKDIFPQNAVDLGVLTKSGLKGVIYKYFRGKEKKLYAVSDRIGCMSEANKAYIIEHNSGIDVDKISVVPNSIEPRNVDLTADEKIEMRNKYGIPQDKRIFVYGGNLGRPQDIPFIIECLKSLKDNEQAYFVVVGDGTEYGKLQNFAETEKPTNLKLLKRLPRDDFDRMIAACDVGLIFLDRRFTIPNYPSRLLSYMQACIPVLACTDSNTDVGNDIVNDGYGWWCESSDPKAFAALTEKICSMSGAQLSETGETAKRVLYDKFTVKTSVQKITEDLEHENTGL